MIRDAGFVLESPDGESLPDDAFENVPAFAPGDTIRAAVPVRQAR
jgi:ribosomal protein L19